MQFSKVRIQCTIENSEQYIMIIHILSYTAELQVFLKLLSSEDGQARIDVDRVVHAQVQVQSTDSSHITWA